MYNSNCHLQFHNVKINKQTTVFRQQRFYNQLRGELCDFCLYFFFLFPSVNSKRHYSCPKIFTNLGQFFQITFGWKYFSG